MPNCRRQKFCVVESHSAVINLDLQKGGWFKSQPDYAIAPLRWSDQCMFAKLQSSPEGLVALYAGIGWKVLDSLLAEQLFLDCVVGVTYQVLQMSK